MRCFIAIPLPEAVGDALEAAQRRIPVGRRVPRENLHLTVTFLGEIEEPSLRDLHEAMSGLRSETADVAFGGIDLFGGSSTQILHAQVRLSPSLGALHDRVLRLVRQAGVEHRRERFRPHVTLARLNRPPKAAEAERLAAFLATQPLPVAPAFRAGEVCLFESNLGGGPARYTELACYPLS